MAWVSETAKQSVEGVCPQILRPRRVCISWSGVALREVSVGDDLSAAPPSGVVGMLLHTYNCDESQRPPSQ